MRVVELSRCLCNMGEPLESLRQEKCGSRRASCRASVFLATITAPFEFCTWGHKRTVFTDVGHHHLARRSDALVGTKNTPHERQQQRAAGNEA